MKRILIVDDDPGILTVVQSVLEAPGREFVVARNRITAEAAASNTRFNLVISDIFLPDMDRLELVDFLKARDLDYRIILMSGFLSSDPDDCEDARTMTDRLMMEADRKGVYATLRKPVDIDRLRSLAAEALEDEA